MIYSAHLVPLQRTKQLIRTYFDEIRKAAQALDLKRETFRKIVKDVIKVMEKRVEFCKVITDMFESEGLDEKQIIFTDEAHFWLNGYVNKQNYRFWGQENPNVSIAVPLHPQKVSGRLSPTSMLDNVCQSFSK